MQSHYRGSQSVFATPNVGPNLSHLSGYVEDPSLQVSKFDASNERHSGINGHGNGIADRKSKGIKIRRLQSATNFVVGQLRELRNEREHTPNNSFALASTHPQGVGTTNRDDGTNSNILRKRMSHIGASTHSGPDALIKQTSFDKIQTKKDMVEVASKFNQAVMKVQDVQPHARGGNNDALTRFKNINRKSSLKRGNSVSAGFTSRY